MNPLRAFVRRTLLEQVRREFADGAGVLVSERVYLVEGPEPTPQTTATAPDVWVLEVEPVDDERRILGVFGCERAALSRLAGELAEQWPSYFDEDWTDYPWPSDFADKSRWEDMLIERFTAADTGLSWFLNSFEVQDSGSQTERQRDVAQH